jgi:hypothetical protein
MACGHTLKKENSVHVSLYIAASLKQANACSSQTLLLLLPVLMIGVPW